MDTNALIDQVLESKKIEDLVAPEAAKSAPPEVTVEKIEGVVGMLKNIEASGGLVNIAMACDLTFQQVKDIQAKMNEKINNLNAEKLIAEGEDVEAVK